MMRLAGLAGCMAVLAVVGASGCKEKTHITVIQQAPAEPPPPVAVVEAPPPAVVVEPAPAPVVVAPAPAPVVLAPAPVVVEPVVTPAVSVGFFVEKLGHHGHWVGVATYGQVWVPGGVAVGWQPYSLGHWVYTDAYGWTWVSDEPWGWATYHYGRWVFVEPQGWVWVPGTVWAPAWVVWRSGGGYVGWAPMPPEAVVAPVAMSSTEVSINININVEKHIHEKHWVFVEEKHILEPVHAHIVISSRSGWIMNATRPSTHIVEVNGRIVNRSLAVHDVERAVGRPVRSTRLREVDAATTTDARTASRGDEVVVPRARLRPIEGARTSNATPARGNPATPSRTSGRPPLGETPAPKPAGNVTRLPEARTGVPAAADAPRKMPVPTGKIDRSQTYPAGANGAATPAPARTSTEGRARLNPNPVSAADHTPAGTPAVVHQGPAPATDAPTPGKVRRADNRPSPVVTEGQDAKVDRPNPRRVREAQPAPAAAAAEKAQPSNERVRTARRGAESGPAPAAAGEASGRRERGADARHDKSRTESERRGEGNEKPND